MQTVEVGITGMTCGHCVMSVTEELSDIGATEVAIDLVKGGVSTARVHFASPVEEAAIIGAVSEAGYQVESIS